MARYQKGVAFSGSPFIRKVVPWNYSQDDLFELERCARDPIYFIETYVFIKSVDSEDLIHFKLRGYQREMVTKMIENREFICCLPRQVGKTVCVSAVLLWFMIFNKNYSILVAAHKGDKARDVLAGIKQMYELLPPFLQHGVIEWNKGNIVLETNSRIRAAATSGTSARGDVANYVYVDEAAFIQTHIAEAFFQSVIPTISSGTTSKITVTSTPKGLNHFYGMWNAAIDGRSGYAWTRIRWNDVPGRDEKFREKIVSQFGLNYWNQEFGAEFIGSSYTLVAASKLMSLSANRPVIESPITRVYATAEPGRQYVVCADVSEGVMGDYSVATVMDISSLPYRIACVYRCNTVSTMAYPQVLLNMARTYNMALVMVETTGIGQEVANALMHDLDYENVALTQPSKKSLGRTLAGMFSGSALSRVGLRMDAQSRAIGCGKLKAMVEGDQLIIDDEWAIDEIRRFAIGKGKKYEAEEGHDDVVMSLVIFAWMVDQGYMRDTNDLSVAGAVRLGTAKTIEDEMLPMGFSTHDPVTPPAPVMASRDWWEAWARDEVGDPVPEHEKWERINQRYPD